MPGEEPAGTELPGCNPEQNNPELLWESSLGAFTPRTASAPSVPTARGSAGNKDPVHALSSEVPPEGFSCQELRGESSTDLAGLCGKCGVSEGVPCAQINTWSPIANMLSRRSSAGVAVLEGMLYVAGGNDGTSCLNSVERYNPKSNTWESVAPMNIRR